MLVVQSQQSELFVRVQKRIYPKIFNVHETSAMTTSTQKTTVHYFRGTKSGFGTVTRLLVAKTLIISRYRDYFEVVVVSIM